MYYAFLIAAVVLFSFQFLFHQQFENACGSSISASMLFSLYSSVGGFIILFAINGFQLSFSFYSFIIAILYAAVGLLYTGAGMKAFGEVNLSAYSVFAMLGGMLLPSLYGILFCNEPFGCVKALCFTLIGIAMLLGIDFKQKSGKKRYYVAVFILNGMTGVISVIHQQNLSAVDSFSFLMLTRIITAIIALPFCLALPQVFHKTTGKALVCSFGYTAFCGIGNLLVLLALKHLPASVQYPIITGGVMVVSMLISWMRKEKIGRKAVISTAIAFLSTFLIIL